MRSVGLSPAAREESLRAMAASELDVLVIGGGVVGAGAALDAATRGLSVGLVEARDFASGTSSRSSKLIHGGLRYLEMLDFRLVAEALAERGLLIQTIAPHLVRPVPFLYPLQHRGGAPLRRHGRRALRRSGMLGVRGPRHRHLTRRGARRIMPSLRWTRWWARCGRRPGRRPAHALHRTPRTRHVASGPGSPGCCGASGSAVARQESGATIRVRAQQVVGSVADDTRTGGAAIPRARQQGIPRRAARPDPAGLILRTEVGARVIPAGPPLDHRHTTPPGRWTRPPPRRPPTSTTSSARQHRAGGAIDRRTSRACSEMRPLLSSESDSVKLSREHAVAHTARIVVARAAGTTYRVMARDASTGRSGDRRQVPPSVTESIRCWAPTGTRPSRTPANSPTAGCVAASSTSWALAHWPTRCSTSSPTRRWASHWRARRTTCGRSSAGVARAPGTWTCSPAARISIETFDRGIGAMEEAARLAAPVLGWSEGQVAREVEHYRKRVEAERESQTMPDDETADSARMGAPEVVPLR